MVTSHVTHTPPPPPPLSRNPRLKYGAAQNCSRGASQHYPREDSAALLTAYSRRLHKACSRYTFFTPVCDREQVLRFCVRICPIILKTLSRHPQISPGHRTGHSYEYLRYCLTINRHEQLLAFDS